MVGLTGVLGASIRAALKIFGSQLDQPWLRSAFPECSCSTFYALNTSELKAKMHLIITHQKIYAWQRDGKGRRRGGRERGVSTSQICPTAPSTYCMTSLHRNDETCTHRPLDNFPIISAIASSAKRFTII